MGLRQCEKCEEMIDEAKAFCPGCGHAFVVEKVRETRSNFDTADHTMQLGQTMYNQMLSDMGLNISKSPDPVEKKIDVLAPVAQQAKPPSAKPPVELRPLANGKKWIIVTIVVVALVLLLAIAIAALGLIYWFQFR